MKTYYNDLADTHGDRAKTLCEILHILRIIPIEQDEETIRNWIDVTRRMLFDYFELIYPEGLSASAKNRDMKLRAKEVRELFTIEIDEKKALKALEDDTAEELTVSFRCLDTDEMEKRGYAGRRNRWETTLGEIREDVANRIGVEYGIMNLLPDVEENIDFKKFCDDYVQAEDAEQRKDSRENVLQPSLQLLGKTESYDFGSVVVLGFKYAGNRGNMVISFGPEEEYYMAHIFNISFAVEDGRFEITKFRFGYATGEGGIGVVFDHENEERELKGKLEEFFN